MNTSHQIRPAGLADIPAIRRVAHTCWPVAYREIISREQIDYMLERMYGEQSLNQQMTAEAHRFFLAESGQTCIGYASIGPVGPETAKLHKLYVLPEVKGSGVGASLIRFVTALLTREGVAVLILQVNRRNPAVEFYRHHGFQIREEVVLDIGEGYYMDDYIMEKMLSDATPGRGVAYSPEG